MTKLPPDMERLRAELLRASGFQDIESPAGVIQRRQVQASALEYARDAGSALVDYECDAFTREILELHVGGLKNRAIVRKLKTYRKLVDQRVSRFKRWVAGELPRRGRPPKPDGMGTDCARVAVRLDEDTLSALFHLRDHLGAELTTSDVVRLAVKAQAKTISVRQKTGGQ